MDHKIIPTLLLIILLFGAASCERPVDPYAYESPHKGTDGLEIEFATNSPPKEVSATQQFPIVVSVHNKGAFDVMGNLSAELFLNYDPIYFSETQYSVDQQLIEKRSHIQAIGKSLAWPEGENRLDTLAIMQANILGTRSVAQTQIGASLCYPYGTELSTTVCVDSDPYGMDQREQVCHAEDQTFSGGQGAPVAITKVEFDSQPAGTTPVNVDGHAPLMENGTLVGTQEVTTTEYLTILRPLVRLTIENVGDGEVIRARDFGQQKLCAPDSNHDYELGSLTVRARLGNRWLVCNPPVVILRDGTAQAECSLPAQDTLLVNTNYYDLLTVELAYVYKSKEVVNIKVDDTQRQSRAPLLLTATCANFNNMYERCKQYSQMGDGVGVLNCFYCPDTGKCLDTTCDGQCGVSTLEDERTRRCAEPCSSAQAPSMGSIQLQGVSSVFVTCDDPDDVESIDHERCGCAHFYYRFVDPDDDCPENAEDLQDNIDGVWNSARGITTGVIMIPPKYQPNRPDQETGKICVAADTIGRVRSTIKQYTIKS